MIVRRNYSHYNGDEAIQKEFGLFGFLTGTGGNAYETRRDLGNGYSEVTKNTLGDKISNFFNGTKKVKNAGYVPGVNETSYRDGGIFTKIGNKAESGFNSMKKSASNVKNSISNTLKSSNAMTPTGSIPGRMTKNPQATQLELFNRDGSPAFEANKPTRLQKKTAVAGGGPLAKAKGSIAPQSSVSQRYAELMKKGKPKGYDVTVKREFFNQKRTAQRERDLFNQRMSNQLKGRSRNTSLADLRKRWLESESMRGYNPSPTTSGRAVATAPPSSLRKVSKLSARPIQAQSGGLLRGASNGATSRLVADGVRSARNGRGYFGFAKRFLRR